MEIKYQGKAIETDATTIAAFLAEWGVKPTEAVVEVDGEIVAAARQRVHLQSKRLQDGVHGICTPVARSRAPCLRRNGRFGIICGVK